MERYGDWDNDSGIDGFEISDSSFGESYIIVYFKTGAKYKYTTASAGPAAIAEMIRLARAGNGLNAYLSRNKPGYAKKW